MAGRPTKQPPLTTENGAPQPDALEIATREINSLKEQLAARDLRIRGLEQAAEAMRDARDHANRQIETLAQENAHLRQARDEAAAPPPEEPDTRRRLYRFHPVSGDTLSWEAPNEDAAQQRQADEPGVWFNSPDEAIAAYTESRE